MPRMCGVDAGCGTGSLLLPLAALITDATFVGVDTKRGSLDRMMARAAAAGPELEGRVVPWHGRIEDYDGAADVGTPGEFDNWTLVRHLTQFFR